MVVSLVQALCYGSPNRLTQWGRNQVDAEEVVRSPEKAQAEGPWEGVGCRQRGIGCLGADVGTRGGPAWKPEPSAEGGPVEGRACPLHPPTPTVPKGVGSLTTRNTGEQPKVHETHFLRHEMQAKVLFVL